MAAVVLGASLPLDPARAGLVRTEQVIEETAAVGDRERLLALVQRDDVRQRMEALGVGANETAARLGSLADAEIRAIAAALDEPPAGQGIVEGVLIGAGVVVLLLIISDLFGVTDVFTFIRGFR